MHRSFTIADLLAYSLSACFVIAGILTLAAGDSRVGETRFIRTPVDIAGSDRVAFGFALLGTGYIFLRWLFRAPGVDRRWNVEMQVFAVFAVVGYVAYRFGVAS